MAKRRYEVTGLTAAFTSKREALRQAKNLARAAQASIMVYELMPETDTYEPIGEEKAEFVPISPIQPLPLPD